MQHTSRDAWEKELQKHAQQLRDVWLNVIYGERLAKQQTPTTPAEGEQPEQVATTQPTAQQPTTQPTTQPPQQQQPAVDVAQLVSQLQQLGNALQGAVETIKRLLDTLGTAK